MCDCVWVTETTVMDFECGDWERAKVDPPAADVNDSATVDVISEEES